MLNTVSPLFVVSPVLVPFLDCVQYTCEYQNFSGPTGSEKHRDHTAMFAVMMFLSSGLLLKHLIAIIFIHISDLKVILQITGTVSPLTHENFNDRPMRLLSAVPQYPRKPL